MSVSLHHDSCCGVTVNDTRADWPGLSVTLSKPASERGGSPVDDGSPTYSWATSLPARCPVLVTVAETRTSCVPVTDARSMCRPLNANVVYDRPYPNGNSGVSLFASYQR